MNSTINLLENLHMPDAPLLAGLFVSTVFYALFLNTPLGKWLRRDETWVTVVIGVAIVLIWAAVDNPAMAARMFWFFGVAGIPIIAESLYRMYRHHEATVAAQVGDRE